MKEYYFQIISGMMWKKIVILWSNFGKMEIGLL